ncbi:MAG: sugar transporter [Tardiphaga sp.]
MLQTPHSQIPLHPQERDEGLNLGQYVQVFKKRWLLFVVPLLVVFAIGLVIVILRPATYASQGKLLVESQQIPSDLVRPTVTATAAARIQVIEQRVMTRDNLLTIVDKFQVFAGHRNWFGGVTTLSGTEALDLARMRARITPIELELRSQRGLNNPMAFAVSFEHESNEMARRVANELMTLILAEDVRSRTTRATETTQFLARENKRLESQLASTDTQISEFKQKNRLVATEQAAKQLAALKADFHQKSALYAPTHPALQPLQQQIAALEKVVGDTSEIMFRLETLERQRATIEGNLKDVSQKLIIAQRGELLERDQHAERLEVLEQPSLPTEPVKGKRLAFLAMVIGASFAAGLGGVMAAELFDRTIRGTSDLEALVDSHIIVGIPYIATRKETLRKRGRSVWVMLILVVGAVAGVAAVHFLWIPLDQLWEKVLLRLMG